MNRSIGKTVPDTVTDTTGLSGVYRLFGDANGTAVVDSSDFNAFRLAFLSANPIFDYDGNGQVAAPDFLQFRLRFLSTV